MNEPGGGERELVEHLHVLAPRDRPHQFSHSLCENCGLAGLRGQFSHKLCEKFRRRQRGIELPHPPEARHRKTAHPGKRLAEVPGQRLDDGVAPAERLLLFHDAAPDVPIKQHQLAVHGAAGIQARRVDAAFYLGEKRGVAGG